MLEVCRGLSPLEEDKLIKYMDSYQRFHTLVNFSNDTYIDKPEKTIKRYEMVWNIIIFI